MADGNSRIFPFEEFGDWRADYTAAAQNHRALASYTNASALYQLNTARWSTRQEAREVADRHTTLVLGVQTGGKGGKEFNRVVG